MTQTLATVTSPALATVQDGGRSGWAHLGVPQSGALHRERYLLATALVRGELDPSCPAVEVLAGAFALRAARDLVFGVTGPADVTVDDDAVLAGTAMRAAAGATVRLAWRGPGPAYLTVAGWEAGQVLGSAATDTFSGLGGDPLTTGAVLRGVARTDDHARVGTFHRRLDPDAGSVRVVAVDDEDASGLVARLWTVQATARSGVRLAGGAVPAAGGMPSRPTLPGAVQLTPAGEPIILGPDGGVTGGYPVPAVVATVDRDRLSLLAVGDPLRFRIVTVAEAVEAWHDHEARLRGRLAHPDQAR